MKFGNALPCCLTLLPLTWLLQKESWARQKLGSTYQIQRHLFVSLWDLPLGIFPHLLAAKSLSDALPSGLNATGHDIKDTLHWHSCPLPSAECSQTVLLL